MSITMVDVISADGRMTHGDDQLVTHWSSKEDFAHFTKLIHAHELVVMGRKTYEAVQPTLEPERLRVVMTRTPERFESAQVPDQLEFCKLAPAALVQQMETRGYTSMLVVGGSHVNGAFLEAGLVHELYLTIEPVLFGSGVRVADSLSKPVTLQLLGQRTLNTRGTLLLHYQVGA